MRAYINKTLCKQAHRQTFAESFINVSTIETGTLYISNFILFLFFLLRQLSAHVEAHANLKQCCGRCQEEDIFRTEFLPDDTQYG